MNDSESRVELVAQVGEMRKAIELLMEERNVMMLQRQEVLRGLPNCESVGEVQRFVWEVFEVG